MTFTSASILMGGLVIVTINEARRNVHRALLFEHSGWFRDALNVEVPGKTKIPPVLLADVETGIFEIFVG
ncbi:hypothetical protein B5807_03870 [Epicoccum nigrum]|uniref:BTB domain-containing protein n=1 Tax=Epicoccum nigrum TaxID=105696 RepID=A0A1Y2M8L2_EPING|nr:hypothetical protein B5807_03870 [Epicoccum nigrum]